MKTDEEIISEWWKLIDTDSELRSAIRLYRMAERSRKPNYCDMEKASYEYHKAHHPDGTTHVCYFCECEEQAHADERRKTISSLAKSITPKEARGIGLVFNETALKEAYAKGKADGKIEQTEKLNRQWLETVHQVRINEREAGRKEGQANLKYELLSKETVMAILNENPIGIHNDAETKVRFIIAVAIKSASESLGESLQHVSAERIDGRKPLGKGQTTAQKSGNDGDSSHAKPPTTPKPEKPYTCQECGEAHEWGDGHTPDGRTHWQSCIKCGKKKED